MDLTNLLAARLKRERIQAGLSLAKAAARLHSTKSQVQRLENGTRTLTFEWISRLCRAYGLDPLAILAEYGSDATAQERNTASKENAPRHRNLIGASSASRGGNWLTVTTRDLPIFGHLEAEGILRIPKGGKPVGYAHRPPQLADAREAYATYAPTDNCMKPRYISGQILWVVPHIPANPGDGVLVILKDRRAFPRELVSRTADRITVRQYQPERTRTIQMDEIESIHRIVGAIDPI